MTVVHIEIPFAMGGHEVDQTRLALCDVTDGPCKGLFSGELGHLCRRRLAENVPRVDFTGLCAGLKDHHVNQIDVEALSQGRVLVGVDHLILESVGDESILLEELRHLRGLGGTRLHEGVGLHRPVEFSEYGCCLLRQCEALVGGQIQTGTVLRTQDVGEQHDGYDCPGQQDGIRPIAE